MKTLNLVACILFVTYSSTQAEESTQSFLEVGKSYNLEYPLDSHKIPESNFPQFVTIMQHGPSEWYFVKPCGEESPLWINFSNVFSVREVNSDFIKHLDAQIKQTQSRRMIRPPAHTAEQGAAANP
jgi:hypothetical protein